MEVKQYFTLILHWLWLIILGVVVAGAVAYMVSINTSAVYRSTPVRLLVDAAPGEQYQNILLERGLTQTYIELIPTHPVMLDTIERLNLSHRYSPEMLKNKLNISSRQDGQLISISVEDENPELAAVIANTIAAVFIERNSERQLLRYRQSLERYEELLELLRDERQDIQTQIARLGTPTTAEEEAQLSRLRTQLNEAELRHTQAFNDLESIRVSQAKETSNVIIVEEAFPNGVPIRPRTVSNTILAAVVGGMLALGIVFLVEYLDDTVKSPDEILQSTGLSTLAAIAFIKADEIQERLITHLTPRAPISEAYRVLRTNLSYSAVDDGLGSLLISSSSPGEGKSTTAANLAVVVAQTGQRVIIVDADLRRPMQHKIFSAGNNYGLTTALLDNQTPVKQHLQKTAVTGLRLLSSGPIPPNPAELLNSQRMVHILSELKEECDFVIFDTPPALTVADASILAPRVDGCVLVIQVGETRHDVVVQAVERLQKTGATLFGVVMNRLKVGRTGYYYDYYYRHYSYEYENPNRSRRRVADRLPRWLSSLTNRL